EIRIAETGQAVIKLECAAYRLRLVLIIHLKSPNVEPGFEIVAAVKPGDVVCPLVGVGALVIAGSPGIRTLKLVHASELERWHSRQHGIVRRIRDHFEADLRDDIRPIIEVKPETEIPAEAELQFVDEVRADGMRVRDHDAAARMISAPVTGAVALLQRARADVLVIDGEANTHE